DGAGSDLTVSLGGEPRQVPQADGIEWHAGHAGRPAPQVSSSAIASVPDAGDFEADQALSVSAWVHLPANDSTGAIVARMNDQDGYRGWDMWVEGRRIGMHLIHRWNQDAIKVVSREQIPANRWVHVTVTYDGSRKAAGIKVYFDGRPKPTNVQADSLQGSIRTDVGLTIGRRHTSSLISGAMIQDLRVYDRELAAGQVEALANASIFAAIIGK